MVTAILASAVAVAINFATGDSASVWAWGSVVILTVVSGLAAGKQGTLRNRKRGGRKVEKALSSARLLHERGQFAEAETEIRNAIADNESDLGEADPAILAAHSLLGSILLGRDDLIEAESEFRHSVEVSQRVFGKEDPKTLYVRSNLANALRELGKFDESEREYRKLVWPQLNEIDLA